MRLTIILIFSLILFVCVSARGYTITPDKTFIIDDTTYCFNHTTNVSTIGKVGAWFIADDLHMQAIPSDNASLVIKINSFDSSVVNFSYHANRSCSIFFNCSGNAFSKYYIGGNETINVSFSSSVVPDVLHNKTVDALMNVSNVLNTSLFSFLPIICIVFVGGIALMFLTRL